MLGLRKISEHESYWWLPGGSVEGTEKGLEAGFRELQEELELDAGSLSTINSYLLNNIYIPNVTYFTDVSENTLYFIDIGPLFEEPVFPIKDEFVDIKWFSTKQLPSNMSREFPLVDNFFSEKWLKSISQL